jgi:hypothetical protein
VFNQDCIYLHPHALIFTHATTLTTTESTQHFRKSAASTTSSTMIGAMRINLSRGPSRGNTNVALQPAFRADMTPDDANGKFRGKYKATVSLFDDYSGTAMNELLAGTRTVDGDQQRDDLVVFTWQDLRVTRAGTYQLEVSIWEKGQAPPKNPKDTHFGTEFTEFTLVILD